MKEHRIVAAFAFVILALCVTGIARADNAWDEDTVQWTAPTICNGGQAITVCPVQSYKVETASSKTATAWTTVGTTVPTVLTIKVAGLTAGTHCYRVTAVGTAGSSTAAIQGNDCPVTVAPVPGPPTNVLTVSDPIAYSVRPNLQRFVFERGPRIGSVKLGASCDETRSTGDGFYVIDRLSQIKPRPAQGTVAVARCS